MDSSVTLHKAIEGETSSEYQWALPIMVVSGTLWGINYEGKWLRLAMHDPLTVAAKDLGMHVRWTGTLLVTMPDSLPVAPLDVLKKIRWEAAVAHLNDGPKAELQRKYMVVV